MKKRIKMDQIERLTYGKKSGARIGSRRVGHHLQPFEREIYERCLKKGFLDVDERSRENLFNVWEKVCLAKGWKNVVIVKSKGRISAIVYLEGVEVFSGSLQEAKQIAKSESSNNR